MGAEPMDESFRVEVDRMTAFGFNATFPGKPYDGVRFDEPAPLGADAAPSAERMLAATIGNCLAASLLLCLEKSRADVGDIKAVVEGRLGRNERGRWRITELHVTLHAPGVAPEKLARCRELFEDYCIVTQSVRSGLKVDVEVEGATTNDRPTP